MYIIVHDRTNYNILLLFLNMTTTFTLTKYIKDMKKIKSLVEMFFSKKSLILKISNQPFFLMSVSK